METPAARGGAFRQAHRALGQSLLRTEKLSFLRRPGELPLSLESGSLARRAAWSCCNRCQLGQDGSTIILLRWAPTEWVG
jgi:hypothetical protein